MEEYEVRRNGLVELVKDFYRAEWKESQYKLVYVAFYGDSPPRHMFSGPLISLGDCGCIDTEEGACRYEIVISDSAISHGDYATLAEVAIPRAGDVLVSYYYISWTSRNRWEKLFSVRAPVPEAQDGHSHAGGEFKPDPASCPVENAGEDG